MASLFDRLVWQESKNNPYAVNPTTGASGSAQIMEATAADPGFGLAPMPWDQRFNEKVNKQFGNEYLNAMLGRYGGDEVSALAAYNWGPGNTDKWVAGGKNWNALPAETQGYISNIMGGDMDAPLSAQGMMLPPIVASAPELTPEQKKVQRQNLTMNVLAELFGSIGGARSADWSSINNMRQMDEQKRQQAAQAQADRGFMLQQGNATIQYLYKAGRDDLAQAVQTGAMSPQQAMTYVADLNNKRLEAGPGLPEGVLSKDQMQIANTLRDDFTNENKNQLDILNNFENIHNALDVEGGVSDVQLAVSFAKVLDPGSVAREGEVSVIANARGLGESLTASLMNALKGEGQLAPSQRMQIYTLARQKYNRSVSKMQDARRRYAQIASRQRIPEIDVMGGFDPYDEYSVFEMAKRAHRTGDSFSTMKEIAHGFGRLTQTQQRGFIASIDPADRAAFYENLSADDKVALKRALGGN